MHMHAPTATPLRSQSNMRPSRPPHRRRPASSLKHVVEKLVKNGLHRLYVVDDELKPTGVITLTDILSRVCLEPEQAEA